MSKQDRRKSKLGGGKKNLEVKGVVEVVGKTRTATLVEPDLIEKSQDVARLTLTLAKRVLESGKDGKLSETESIALKRSYDLLSEIAKRTEPVIHRNVNLHVKATEDRDLLVDLSSYRDLGGEENREQVINAEFSKEEPQ